MPLSRVLFCSAASLWAVPGLAQPNDEGDSDRDVLVVEGTRLAQTPREVGSSVTIIDRDDFQKLDFDFALDAIASAPGVTVNQNGPFGGQATVRIRGASSEQTLVLIDGVPVNDASTPGGGFDFGRLDTENIEKVEILKGPQSVLWGSDAIGGVVSVTTRKPGSGPVATVFGEYGSFNTLRAGGSVDRTGKLGDFRLGVVGLSSDGISRADEDNGNTEEDGFRSLNLAAGYDVDLPSGITIDADALWTGASSDFDSFSGTTEGNVTDGDEVTETEELTTNISLRAPLDGGRVENLVQVGYSDIDRRSFTDDQPGFEAEGSRTILRYQGTVNVDDANTLSFGAEREVSAANDEDVSIGSLFGLYELKPFGGLTLTAGVRADDHSQFGSVTTSRVAAAYAASPHWVFRASWGEGFKAPSIFQQTFVCTFCGLTEPNRNLRPETSEGFDIDADWRSEGGRAFASITYFEQETENLIDFDFTAGYDNIALADTSGIETVAGYRVSAWLELQANYTLLEAEDGEGTQLTRLPKHSGEMRASFDPSGPISGAILVRHNGEETNTNGTTLDAWTRIDLTARYVLSKQVEMFARAENLLDEDYQQILGYGTPGLSGSIGLRLRY
jgi:vitamin B12 transporter